MIARLLLGSWIPIFFSLVVWGQPTAYYQTAYNLAGEALHEALHDIIDQHTTYPYTSSQTDVWDILKVTDRDPTNPNNVILLYCGASVDADQEWNNGKGWSREHVWAKSRGDFGTSKGAGTDVHHLRPADPGINSTRNNRGFDACIACNPVLFNNVATGSFSDGQAWTFEPRQAIKGDIARMIFYMALRYDAVDGLDLTLTDSIFSQTDKQPLHGKQSTLLAWHQIDPVDNREQYRNEVIEQQFQGNRNPFIDYPELAEHLWGSLQQEPWRPIATAQRDIAHQKATLYPNPAQAWLRIAVTKAQTVHIIDAMGRHCRSIEISAGDTMVDIQSLPAGSYHLQLSDGLTLPWTKLP